ncbi:glycosyl transferase family 28 [Gleimia sp. 6138-11-ORH1]|uniref:glycosyltransferase family protein n=1 Tax=Gleimia sp. 6138-11-ORH1 TaxID=2973937 RepID=UPI002168A329|nr:glycosyltransferase [Gleimia sp. 6138-11-ORH1]MCS4484929.1 glycosyl transferase family 28 [Gleimia sp. 6138-11-ORH1]
MNENPLKIVLYSHDSQGLGHIRRNLAIAHQLVQDLPRLTGRSVSGLLISGLAPTHRFPLPTGFDWVTIPGVSKGANGYQARSLKSETGRLIGLRSELIKAALIGFNPDLVIVDRHIYGVWNELRHPLQALKAQNRHAKIVLGLREILDEPDVVAKEWEALGDLTALAELLDNVWVYGDEKVYNPLENGQIPTQLAPLAKFTGYLAHGRRKTDSQAAAEQIAETTRPFILTTTGGGEDGQRILTAAVAAKVPAAYRHLIVTGPQLDEAAVNDLRTQASENTQIIQSLPGLGRHIGEASAVIAMGGYNTVCEILATNVPALIIPREIPRKEQLIRAKALHRINAVDYLRNEEATATAIENWLARVLETTNERTGINKDGLTTVSEYAAQLLQTR